MWLDSVPEFMLDTRHRYVFAARWAPVCATIAMSRSWLGAFLFGHERGLSGGRGRADSDASITQLMAGANDEHSHHLPTEVTSAGASTPTKIEMLKLCCSVP